MLYRLSLHHLLMHSEYILLQQKAPMTISLFMLILLLCSLQPCRVKASTSASHSGGCFGICRYGDLPLRCCVQVLAIEKGCVEAIVLSMQQFLGDPTMQTNGCHALANIFSLSIPEALRHQTVQSGAISAVRAARLAHPHSENVQENCKWALDNITFHGLFDDPDLGLAPTGPVGAGHTAGRTRILDPETHADRTPQPLSDAPVPPSSALHVSAKSASQTSPQALLWCSRFALLPLQLSYPSSVYVYSSSSLPPYLLPPPLFFRWTLGMCQTSDTTGVRNTTG